MTEYFRITGLNNVLFDQAAAAANNRYRLVQGQSPKGIDKPLTREETLGRLRQLPEKIRGHVLSQYERGEHLMSVITFPFSIQGSSDADMEDAEHDLRETLEDTKLYFSTRGARGTRALLEMKSNLAADMSYKSIFYGEFMEDGGRTILGDAIKEHYIRGLQMTLYCEPYWRPSASVTLGPNEIMCPSFEEDGDADGLADNWNEVGTPTTSIESTIVLHGADSQKIITDTSTGEGIYTDNVSDPSATSCVAYAWIYRSAGDDISVIIYDDDAPAAKGTAKLDTGGWDTETGGGQTWSKVVISATGLTAGNNHNLRIQRGSGDATQATTFYVDKCFWLWGTTTEPDEWCDHYLIYNHWDTTEGAAHEGHQNYFDVDDLKGDVPGRLLMRVEFEQAADKNAVLDLIIGRRTRGTIGNFIHWLEAEDGSTQTNWADTPIAACSGGNCVSNAASATGQVIWNLATIYGNIDDFAGTFDVFSAVFTDDPTNTQYKLNYTIGPVTYNGQWKKQSLTNKWGLLYLGAVDFSQLMRSGVTVAQDWGINVEYEKDASDTARLDFIWLVSRDEPETRVEYEGTNLNVGEWWVMGQDEDFDYLAVETGAPPDWFGPLSLRGTPGFMVLEPRRENRLYFVCISLDGADEIYEAHGAGTDLQMKVNIDYLPQYISPLE